MEKKIDEIFNDLNSSPEHNKFHSTEKAYSNIVDALMRERIENMRLENEARKGENIGNEQNRNQRKEFAERIFSFVSLYMFFVFLLLFLSGCEYAYFHLSDTVLVTLLGTTTANVISVLVIVVTYLFSRKQKR